MKTLHRYEITVSATSTRRTRSIVITAADEMEALRRVHSMYARRSGLYFSINRMGK